MTHVTAGYYGNREVGEHCGIGGGRGGMVFRQTMLAFSDTLIYPCVVFVMGRPSRCYIKMALRCLSSLQWSMASDVYEYGLG